VRFIRLFLLPVSILYYWATGIRNWLYDSGYFKSFDLDISSIAVGNLTVGGTGKTPFIEYLIRTLHQDFKITTLSRGYKRKSRGLVIAGDQDTARTIGDEPYQFQKKFGHTIGVAVCEDRLLAIPHILQARPDTNLILLDDAYQHRQVKPSCNLLISDYNKPFYKDYLLPAGNLRESRNGALRADAVIVTKCPENISEPETVEVEETVQRYTRPGVPVYFMNIQYEPVTAAFNGSTPFGDDVLLVTAIAMRFPLVKDGDKITSAPARLSCLMFSPSLTLVMTFTLGLRSLAVKVIKTFESSLGVVTINIPAPDIPA